MTLRWSVHDFFGRRRLGLYVARSQAVVVDSRSGVIIAECALDLESPAPDRASVIGQMLAQVRERVGGGNNRVSVALGPGIASAKVVELPRVSRQRLRAAALRGAHRYFPTLAENAVVAAEPQGGTQSGPDDIANASRVDVVVAISPEDELTALYVLIRQAGMIVESAVPRSATFAAASRILSVARDRRFSLLSLIAIDGDRAEVVHSRGGAIVGVRHVRLGGRSDINDVGSVLRCLSDLPEHDRAAGKIAVVGDAVVRLHLEDKLRQSGYVVLDWPEHRRPAASSAAGLAAYLAARTAGPQLVPPDVTRALRARNRRLTAGFASATAALLAIAMVVDLWGSRRELRSIEQARRQIRPAVERLVRQQDSIQLARRQAEFAEHFGERSPTWTEAFATLATRLPDESFVAHLVASGDTLEIDAVSDDATPSLEALRTMPTVRAARTLGAIRRDPLKDGASVDRFQVALLLGRPDVKGTIGSGLARGVRK